MDLFTEQIKKQLQEILQKLQNKVTIAFFTQEFECDSCKETHEFLDEFVALSDKLEMKVYDFKQDSDIAKEYGVDKIPAMVILTAKDKDNGIRFFGLPGGYEINSFISSLLEVSGQKHELNDELMKRINAIKKNVRIQVFITLGCPHCPGAVSNAHHLAMSNEHISADMVDASSFNTESIKYSVSAVPKIIINEEHELVGNQPIEKYLEIIENL
ncbi:MAG: thioredoxin family protein [Candidatus Celaenobacter antarcticus]|nr:thioredoxin family protein [Candidatus Celaenobacter antarcticus]MDP8313800.1 thioredoxin family protein [Candidatus Celaenobacter antarcticus]